MKTKDVLFTLSAVLFAAAAAWAADMTILREPEVEYSADSYMETEEGVLKGKVFYAPGKERREMDAGGMQTVLIRREDKNLMWTIMPAQKMYMESSLKEGKAERGDLSGYKMEITEVGEETIDGLKTKKHKLIMTGPKGDKMGGFIWVTSERISVKMDAIAQSGGSKKLFKTRLTNLKIGKQNPSLFDIPAGYTKMSVPGFPGLGGFGTSK